MMTIQEQVRTDMISAMKAREKEKTTLLKTLMGFFQRVGKDVSDDEAIKQIKTLLDAAKEMNNQFEIDILSSYLPTMMDSKEIEASVVDIIKGNNFEGMKDMGKIMGMLKVKHGNTFDGKLASQIVKERLL